MPYSVLEAMSLGCSVDRHSCRPAFRLIKITTTACLFPRTTSKHWRPPARALDDHALTASLAGKLGSIAAHSTDRTSSHGRPFRPMRMQSICSSGAGRLELGRLPQHQPVARKVAVEHDLVAAILTSPPPPFASRCQPMLPIDLGPVRHGLKCVHPTTGSERTKAGLPPAHRARAKRDQIIARGVIGLSSRLCHRHRRITRLGPISTSGAYGAAADPTHRGLGARGC